MTAAPLFLASARNWQVVCLAHVANAMALAEGDLADALS